MKRRQFIALLGGAAATLPLAAHAQPAERMRRIGVLLATSENDAESQARITVFQEGLDRLRWTVGGNVRLDYRWYAGDTQKARIAAAELLALSPDILVANGNVATLVLQKATRIIPIVFAVVTDPVGEKMVQSLARPGGNITGFTNQPVEGAKFLALLKEIAPGVKRVSIMTGHSLVSDAAFVSAQAAASRFSVEASKVVVREPSDIEPALTALERNGDGGLIIPGDTVTSSHRKLIVDLAASHRIPAVYGFRFFVREGGLLSHGIDTLGLFRQAATYVDRILRGEKPADLPVQQPTKFDLAINLKTAKALGLDVPLTLLASADEVIE